MAIIGDDDRGRTDSASVLHIRNSGGHPGRDWTGVSCVYCGEPIASAPGQSGTAFYGCPRGCNSPSGGGVTKKTIQDVQRELNQKRSWKERASLKER